MVKPEKLSFPCLYCGKEFRKKMSLERHLFSHPGYATISRLPRIRSNWCPACKRRFSESEYKLHIEIEHKFDKFKIPFRIIHKENEYVTNYITAENIPCATTPRGVDKISPIKVGKKRGRKPGKTVQTPYNTRMKIKTESPDTCKTKKSLLENKKVASNSSSAETCELCGFGSKTPRGLKIHFTAMHKKKREKGCKPKKSPYIHKIQKTATSIKQKQRGKDSNQDDNSTKTSNNSQPLFVTNTVPNQITVTGAGYNLQQLPFNKIIFIVNPSDVQNPQVPNFNHPNQFNVQNPQVPNFNHPNQFNVQNPQVPNFNHPNQFNVQNPSTCGNPNPQVLMFSPIRPFSVQNSTVGNESPQVPEFDDENYDILKFDCNSEKYIKWLKNFIGRCIAHGYPLTPMMCQKLSHINAEITDFLTNLENPLVKRANHFYFYKIRGTLNEIMMGQLRNSMSAVSR